ncbi:hypothetical protein [Comamonas terrigena]|uniref:hypothetical protein n=1 Tax=Comamonas terrigena TaxID=32013 RepID=UPI002449E1C7|nr:hypothetical protein [Comamonas terrigena]MDH0048597.1 hypothetical protein [Comamonas terrigena]MDH0511577.1 hypothetical protein [Comamonas terrigena]MDH1090964.1 hypothetical protein [Comamonas terrigena]
MTKKTPHLLDIGRWPKWKQIALFLVVFVLGMAALEYAKSMRRGTPADTSMGIAQKLHQEAANSPAPDFMYVSDKAKAGDYQAQRNLAYGYAAQPYPGQEKNRLLACAWYLVVLNSNHPQADGGDVSNVETYCGALDADSLNTAKSRATQFLAEISAAQKLTKLP